MSPARFCSVVVSLMFLVLSDASSAKIAPENGAGDSYELDAAYEQEVLWAVGELMGREVASLSCPPASNLRREMSFECIGEFADGEPLFVELETLGRSMVNILRINGEVPRGAEPTTDEKVARAIASTFASTPFGISLLVVAALMIAAGFRALVGFLRLQRNQYVSSELEILPEQRVSFPAPGSYVLYHRGSRRLFWEIRRYVPALWDESQSAYLHSYDMLLFGIRTAGLAKIQRPWKSFAVPRAGEYVLVVGELDDRVRPSDRLIFGQARQLHLLLLLAGTIIGLLAGANLLMFGIWILAS